MGRPRVAGAFLIDNFLKVWKRDFLMCSHISSGTGEVVFVGATRNCFLVEELEEVAWRTFRAHVVLKIYSTTFGDC